ncbi:eosinophil cationic protein-like [Meriones unguiculatus]|uniref:eosinophil cationic protein-like n=1 Tax=Meriones unguiculatus TaxID=10047 RepID=UPI000B4EB018|nr:eosinophil cationic protein-like [Meriones unguiculatus]XP_060247725.1 eosinophil cationic protein-like [Meriones unguiculatus]
MGLKLLVSRLCLLLLLGLVLMVASFQIPPGLTPSRWFTIQHISNTTTIQCNAAMLGVNNYTGRCKDLNTFLHTGFTNIVNVCYNRNTTCKNGRRNCHDSRSKVSITDCNLTSPSANYRQCRYQRTRARKFYRIACNNKTPRDNPNYPVVPVHLDGTFI